MAGVDAMSELDNKQAAERLLQQKKIRRHGYVVISARDAAERQEWHKWAAEQKFVHMGFVDEKMPYDYQYKYWCSVCTEWRYGNNPRHTRRWTCCEYCSDWSIHCEVCYDPKDDDDLYGQELWDNTLAETVGHGKDPDDPDSRCRRYKGNNAILILADSDLNSLANRTILKAFGMKKRRLLRRLRRQVHK